MDFALHYILTIGEYSWISCMYPMQVLMSLCLSYSCYGRQELRRNHHLPVFDFVCFLYYIYVHPDLVFHKWWKTPGCRLYVWKNDTSPEFIFLQQMKGLMSQLSFIKITFKFIQGQALQIITKRKIVWE